MAHSSKILFIFFFNDTATTEIYTLSIHDALPILANAALAAVRQWAYRPLKINGIPVEVARSEEHTSELQSRRDLVCRLLLEKKKRLSAAHKAPKKKLKNIPIKK